MTIDIDETIRVLSNELACVMRQTGPGCDRNCAACDLVLPDELVISAYRTAINVLCTQQDEDKRHARAGFVRCGYVQFAEAFGDHLRPYKGCPRGPEGLKGFPPGQEPGRIKAVIGYLIDAKDNVLAGPDEDYVCVPKMWYDHCITILREMEDGGKEFDDSLEDGVALYRPPKEGQT